MKQNFIKYGNLGINKKYPCLVCPREKLGRRVLVPGRGGYRIFPRGGKKSVWGIRAKIVCPPPPLEKKNVSGNWLAKRAKHFWLPSEKMLWGPGLWRPPTLESAPGFTNHRYNAVQSNELYFMNLPRSTLGFQMDFKQTRNISEFLDEIPQTYSGFILYFILSKALDLDIANLPTKMY